MTRRSWLPSVAVIDDRARALAEQHGVEQVFTDYQAMIDRAGLDAVAVVTPEDLHHPMVMAALRAGLHVLCEKPMAFSAAESEEMLAAAEQRWGEAHGAVHQPWAAALPLRQGAAR